MNTKLDISSFYFKTFDLFSDLVNLARCQFGVNNKIKIYHQQPRRMLRDIKSILLSILHGMFSMNKSEYYDACNESLASDRHEVMDKSCSIFEHLFYIVRR